MAKCSHGDSAITNGKCYQCAGVGHSTQAAGGLGQRMVPPQPLAQRMGCMNPDVRQAKVALGAVGGPAPCRRGGRQPASAAGGHPGPWSSCQRGHSHGWETRAQGAGPCLSGLPPKPGTSQITGSREPAQQFSICCGSQSRTYLHSLSGVDFHFICKSFSFQFILQAFDFN